MNTRYGYTFVSLAPPRYRRHRPSNGNDATGVARLPASFARRRIPRESSTMTRRSSGNIPIAVAVALLCFARPGGVTSAADVRLTVVPPAGVTDRVSVEARVAIPNSTDRARKYEVAVYWDEV